MAYNNRFVVTILSDGNILKELANGSVPIEFNSEYKIRLRNKHSRRAICQLSIDGEDISGGGFIIPANSFIDIERPHNVAKKFKFVDLESEEAYDFGKNGQNYDKVKGTIVANFALEKEVAYVPIRVPYYPDPIWYPYLPKKTWYPDPIGSFPGLWCQSEQKDCLNDNLNSSLKLRSQSLNQISSVSSVSSVSCVNPTPPNSSRATLEVRETFDSHNLKDGATVEGSNSNQRFSSVYFNHEEEWTTVKLFLQGFDSEDRLVDPAICQKINYKFKENKKPLEDLKLEINKLFKDNELEDLEKQLLELKKLKVKKEIEKLQKELV